MQSLRTHIPFFFSALLFVVVVWDIFPYYQYYVDTDATAYLTIAKRYAAGDYFKAINGYWSPWACWLTAIGIAKGMSPFVSALVVNGMAAVGLLWLMQSFMRLLGVVNGWQYVLSGTIALFLSYAVFKQSFDDLWECFFLLAGLRILLLPDFVRRADLWVWLGITGGFAYYAKAYAFPFFILNTVCCTYYLAEGYKKEKRLRFLKAAGVAILAMVAIALPWIYALYHKYGIWMTSTAGTLNLSWYPVGHPFYKEGIRHLLPPIYPDSPSYWEDPWLVNGATPHFWNSRALFVRQMARVVYNIALFVKCLNEMSAFLLPTYALGFVVIFSRKVRGLFGDKYAIISLSFLLFPTGFILINYEARYIWYMFFPGVLMGAVALQKILPHVERHTYTLIMFVFTAALLVWPLWDMKQLFREGQAEYDLAHRLDKAGIKGTFTANVIFGEGNDLERVSRLAYFSGNPYFNMPRADVPFGALLSDMRRYGLDYYFYYGKEGVGNEPPVLRDSEGQVLPVALQDSVSGLIVYRLR